VGWLQSRYFQDDIVDIILGDMFLVWSTVAPWHSQRCMGMHGASARACLHVIAVVLANICMRIRRNKAPWYLCKEFISNHVSCEHICPFTF